MNTIDWSSENLQKESVNDPIPHQEFMIIMEKMSIFIRTLKWPEQLVRRCTIYVSQNALTSSFYFMRIKHLDMSMRFLSQFLFLF